MRRPGVVWKQGNHSSGYHLERCSLEPPAAWRVPQRSVKTLRRTPAIGGPPSPSNNSSTPTPRLTYTRSALNRHKRWAGHPAPGTRRLSTFGGPSTCPRTRRLRFPERAIKGSLLHRGLSLNGAGLVSRRRERVQARQATHGEPCGYQGRHESHAPITPALARSGVYGGVRKLVDELCKYPAWRRDAGERCPERLLPGLAGQLPAQMRVA